MRIRRFMVTGILTLTWASAWLLTAITPVATAAAAPCFTELPPVPGIPPWGFHTGSPITATNGSYARAAGDINLATNWISGEICQDNRTDGVDHLILLKPESHIISHTHSGAMWGYPGNLIVVDVKVESSNDPSCKVHTIGAMTMFGSYNGVRSDSIQFSFPAACSSHDHLYHGPQVNAQVPPL